MILKFDKSLNDKNDFTLISFDMNDKLDCITLENFDEANCNVYETNENYYYYVKNVINLENSYEKFKIKTKKGDIVSLTGIDNSYIVYPSKKAFSYAFELNYSRVLKFEYVEVLYDGKPYEVKYVEDKEDKMNDGVVYTLSQLAAYISTLIKSYNYRSIKAQSESKGNDEILHRVINKYYSNKTNDIDKKYELNVKKVYLDENNKWHSWTRINETKSNRYSYDYNLLRMFAFMILAKSKKDVETHNDPQYCFSETFDTIEDVYKFLEANQDIVNNFFIETDTLFNKPNEMYSSYAPFMNGVYMFYEFNNCKTYLYRNVDSRYFNEKSLKSTYVSTRFKHKIKGIKINYTF